MSKEAKMRLNKGFVFISLFLIILLAAGAYADTNIQSALQQKKTGTSETIPTVVNCNFKLDSSGSAKFTTEEGKFTKCEIDGRIFLISQKVEVNYKRAAKYGFLSFQASASEKATLTLKYKESDKMTYEISIPPGQALLDYQQLTPLSYKKIQSGKEIFIGDSFTFKNNDYDLTCVKTEKGPCALALIKQGQVILSGSVSSVQDKISLNIIPVEYRPSAESNEIKINSPDRVLLADCNSNIQSYAGNKIKICDFNSLKKFEKVASPKELKEKENPRTIYLSAKKTKKEASIIALTFQEGNTFFKDAIAKRIDAGEAQGIFPWSSTVDGKVLVVQKETLFTTPKGIVLAEVPKQPATAVPPAPKPSGVDVETPADPAAMLSGQQISAENVVPTGKVVDKNTVDKDLSVVSKKTLARRTKDILVPSPIVKKA